MRKEVVRGQRELLDILARRSMMTFSTPALSYFSLVVCVEVLSSISLSYPDMFDCLFDCFDVSEHRGVCPQSLVLRCCKGQLWFCQRSSTAFTHYISTLQPYHFLFNNEDITFKFHTHTHLHLFLQINSSRKFD